ncbi:hypothetical protein INR49_011419 [Caranx melampygus]|nr:hypothetical protein INR49_011419 [Caranx melampygus]
MTLYFVIYCSDHCFYPLSLSPPQNHIISRALDAIDRPVRPVHWSFFFSRRQLPADFSSFVDSNMHKCGDGSDSVIRQRIASLSIALKAQQQQHTPEKLEICQVYKLVSQLLMTGGDQGAVFWIWRSHDEGNENTLPSITLSHHRPMFGILSVLFGVCYSTKLEGRGWC